MISGHFNQIRNKPWKWMTFALQMEWKMGSCTSFHWLIQFPRLLRLVCFYSLSLHPEILEQKRVFRSSTLWNDKKVCSDLHVTSHVSYEGSTRTTILSSYQIMKWLVYTMCYSLMNEYSWHVLTCLVYSITNICSWKCGQSGDRKRSPVKLCQNL